MLVNYVGTSLLRRTGLFTQGLAQTGAGLVTIATGRKARMPLVETAGFGAGLSGIVKLLYAVMAPAGTQV